MRRLARLNGDGRPAAHLDRLPSAQSISGFQFLSVAESQDDESKYRAYESKCRSGKFFNIYCNGMRSHMRCWSSGAAGAVPHSGSKHDTVTSSRVQSNIEMPRAIMRALGSRVSRRWLS